jgi:raffinose/stachyose/melibiose transport system substrate-binding protein
MKLRTLGIALASTALMTTAAMAEDVTLTIESWRTDDLTLWQDKIIPAFEKDNPGIKVVFSPTAPTEYNAALNSKLEAGSAGDLITCRPFDASLALFEAGHLAALDDMDAMSNFSDVAKSAWQTDDGSASFCVPMASVIHGFIYNKDAFEELGLEAQPEDRVLRRARRDQGRRQLHPDGHGHQRPVGSGHDGLQQHRPELLER